MPHSLELSRRLLNTLNKTHENCLVRKRFIAHVLQQWYVIFKEFVLKTDYVQNFKCEGMSDESSN
jgi:hypothetical protein